MRGPERHVNNEINCWLAEQAPSFFINRVGYGTITTHTDGIREYIILRSRRYNKTEANESFNGKDRTLEQTHLRLY